MFVFHHCFSTTSVKANKTFLTVNLVVLLLLCLENLLDNGSSTSDGDVHEAKARTFKCPKDSCSVIRVVKNGSGFSSTFSHLQSCFGSSLMGAFNETKSSLLQQSKSPLFKSFSIANDHEKAVFDWIELIVFLNFLVIPK